MIEAFQYINKAFESKVRLGIMAILMVNEEAILVPWKNWDISYATKVLSDESHGLFFRQPCKAEKLSNRILKP